MAFEVLRHDQVLRVRGTVSPCHGAPVSRVHGPVLRDMHLPLLRLGEIPDEEEVGQDGLLRGGREETGGTRMPRHIDELIAKYGGSPASKSKRWVGKARHVGEGIQGQGRSAEDIAKYGGSSSRKPASSPAARTHATHAPRALAGGSSPSKRRPVEGLEWVSFEGIEVLRLVGHPDGGDQGQGQAKGQDQAQGKEEKNKMTNFIVFSGWKPRPSSNYVACPSDRRPGTFEIYRLEPRELMVQRVERKYVLGQITSLIRQDKVEAERAERWRQEAVAKEEEEIRKSENQPGFYILPGEEDPENHENLLPLGPFWKFEASGSRYSQDDMNDDCFGDDDVEDWAVEMLAAEMKKPDSDRQAIVIIEARNAMDAARGEGHVWWQDGVFRGQPVDTRQAGWGW